MKVAKIVKQKYKGELLTVNQWKLKGYQPKAGEEPERMWANQSSCGSGDPKKFTYDYYYDYQVEKIEK